MSCSHMSHKLSLFPSHQAHDCPRLEKFFSCSLYRMLSSPALSWCCQKLLIPFMHRLGAHLVLLSHDNFGRKKNFAHRVASRWYPSPPNGPHTIPPKTSGALGPAHRCSTCCAPTLGHYTHYIMCCGSLLTCHSGHSRSHFMGMLQIWAKKRCISRHTTPNRLSKKLKMEKAYILIVHVSR